MPPLAFPDDHARVQALSYILWVGSVFLVIKLDGVRMKRAREREGEVDFIDRSPWPYLAFALVCGGLVLPIYFGATRGKTSAMLTGLLWTMITVVASAAVAAAFSYGLAAVSAG